MAMAKQVVGLPISESDSNNLLHVDRYPISEKASNYIDTIAGNGVFLIELFKFGLEKNKGNRNGGMEVFLTCLMVCLTLFAVSSSFYRACRAFHTGFKGQDKACMIATVFTVCLCSIEYFRLAVPTPIFSNAFFKVIPIVLAFGVFVASLVAFCFRQAQIYQPLPHKFISI